MSNSGRRLLARNLKTAVDTPDCWSSRSLSYRAALNAETTKADYKPRTLVTEDYPGGHLDWFSFDMDNAPAPTPALRSRTDTFLPSPVRFRGMPHARWWQLEEGQVYFGDVDAEPTDLARLLVAEFVSTFGDDWYVIPASLPAGCLAKVTLLRVTDTFGKTTTVDPAALLDKGALGSERPWRMFELAGDRDASPRAPVDFYGADACWDPTRACARLCRVCPGRRG